MNRLHPILVLLLVSYIALGSIPVRGESFQNQIQIENWENPNTPFSKYTKRLQEITSSLASSIADFTINNRGKVLAIKDKEIYLTFPQIDKMNEGDKVNVISYEMENGVRVEKKKYTVTVQTIRSNYLIAHSKRYIQSKPSRLIAFRKTNQIRMGMLRFKSFNSNSTNLKVILPELIGAKLARRGKIQLLERLQMDEIIEEQKFTHSGMADPKTLKKIGKLEGVNYLVLGGIIDLNSSALFYTRVVDVETAKIVFSQEKVMKKEAKIAVQ